MKLTRNHLFLCLAAIPVVLHFYLVSSTIVNFPTWGDDFLFFELIEHLKKDSLPDFVAFLFKPHNHIHLLVFGKLFVLLGYVILGSLQLKWIIIAANLMLLGITFTLYRFLKSQSFSTAYLIPITCLLFAPYANIDNYNLIGVVQHTGSIGCLVSIAYLVTQKRHSILLLILLAAYPLISTEGWAMLPFIALYMWITNHPLKKYVIVMGITAIGGLAYLVGQQPTPSNKTPLLDTLTQAPIALLTFLGNAAWPITDTYKIGLNASLGGLLVLLSIWAIRRKIDSPSKWEFPLIIWLQLTLTGAMIVLGRSQGDSISTLILSERFHSYANLALVSTFLLIIPNLEKRTSKWICISICLLYFFGSSAFFNPNKLHCRLRADLSNAYFQSACTSYPMPSAQIHSFIHAPFYQVNSDELLKIPLPKPSKIREIELEIEKKNAGAFSVRIKSIPNKENGDDSRWIIIQSALNPANQLILPFHADKANRPKILEVNSMQLADLSHKNLWLYTIQANNTSRLAYLGSSK